MEEREEEVRTIIGGDLNVRTGTEGGGTEEGEENEGKKGGKRSKDRIINGEGRRLVECLEERDGIF